MKVTTVRFSEDLWAAVADEAEKAGVSASQFIREAALARAAAAAGARGELLFDAFPAGIHDALRMDLLPEDRQATIQEAVNSVSRALAASARSDAQAVRAESQQARRASSAIRKRIPPRRSDPPRTPPTQST